MTKQYNSLQEIYDMGRLPILPFEEHILQERLTHLGVRQSTLATEKAEAMDESSETWHDNYAAETIAASSHGVRDEAEKIKNMLLAAQVVPYGSINADKPGGATLGSIVQVEFSRSDTLPMLLTGAVSELPEEITNNYPGLEATTITSPLGAAILNAQSGDKVSYEASARKIGVTIGEVVVYNSLE